MGRAHLLFPSCTNPLYISAKKFGSGSFFLRIFRKIFDTGCYESFAKELKRRLLETKRGYEELQRSAEQYIRGILLPECEETAAENAEIGGKEQSPTTEAIRVKEGLEVKEGIPEKEQSWAEELRALLKKENAARGVNVAVNDNRVKIELHVIVAYGVSIRAVAQNVLESVRYKVEEYTGLTVEKINVVVEGVRIVDED